MNLKIEIITMIVSGLILSGSNIGVTAGEKSESGAAGAATVTKAKLTPQSICPIMGGQIDKGLYFDHEGKRIYVCCGGCIDAVKKDPEAAIGKIEAAGRAVEVIAEKEPVAAKKKLTLQTNCPVMTGNKFDKSLFVDHAGKRIYVCCGSCIAKVKAEPEKYIGVLETMGQQPATTPVNQKSVKKAM